ncbi:bifunctional hydroxymethylpyrimidine kinase/phosphomethylpyrimidine kinase [Butyricicoccus sp.]|uniref:bifunctional hydroxymethylpyrimidine kinase/phosphomethylpyrimidine kinase n=1 Tax=Butyricicoccus sp. TaxID=2049021 RepID=UPI003F154EAD
MNKVLTIAGSDCSGGAGIQADIKTITAHRMYAMSAITALTAQNTTGVYGVHETPADFLAQQLDCIFTDIVPDAVKIGMVSSAENIAVIADRLRHYNAQNVVLDTVMFSTSGRALLRPEAMDALQAQLLPLAQLITPNIPETEALCGSRIETREQMEQAGFSVAAQTGSAVLVKGGHLAGAADDLLVWNGQAFWFEGARIDNLNTHGTGCTLSSAIACALAAGASMPDAVRQAKAYLTGALRDGLDLGTGNGPLNHCWNL